MDCPLPTPFHFSISFALLSRGLVFILLINKLTFYMLNSLIICVCTHLILSARCECEIMREHTRPPLIYLHIYFPIIVSVAAVMAEPKEQRSALWRRQEQLDRWNISDTNREPVEPRPGTKVKFQDGCVFLAACSSGDKAEVDRLLAKKADINTSNIDGLTALHQVKSLIFVSLNY